MSKLVVLSGIPGSGKSYFSKLLRKKKVGHVYIISSDALRDMVTGSQRNLSEEKLMWKMFYDLAKVYSADTRGVVVLDATNTCVEYRVGNIKPLKSFFDEVDLVVFNVPKEKVMEQNLDREFPIPEVILEEYYDNFVPPQKEDYEFFNNVYVTIGSDLEEVVKKI